MNKKFIFSIFIFFFSVLTLSAQSWVWGKQGKASSNVADEGYSIARDKIGNIYLTGWFKDTLILGVDTLKTNAFNSTDVFLAKYDMNGNVLWAKQSTINSGVSTGLGYFVTTDKAGNAYVAGSFANSINFGANTLNQPYSNPDAFIVKYNPAGNVVWARQSVCPNSAFGVGYSMATDKLNNIYLTGQFKDSITFGSHKVGSNNYNVYIAKFDSNGNTIWVSAPSNNNSFVTTAYSIAADSVGNTYITGTFNDTLHFGLTTLKANDSNQCFLVKYDSAGNVIWAQQSYNSGDARGNAITMDVAGNLYTTGYYQGAFVFGALHLPASPNKDIFIAKYNAAGNIKWIKNAANSSGIGYALATDNNCNFYLSANANSVIVFGNDTFKISAGTDPLVLAKFDSAGTCLCGSIIASGGDDFSGIASDPSGNYVYLGGDLEDSVTFGPDKIGPAPYNATEWIFLAQWQPCSGGPEEVGKVTMNSNKVVIYPNPSNGVFRIQANSYKLMANSQIQVYNMLGEKIANSQWPTANSQMQIDLSNQPAGVYLYRIVSETGDMVSSGKLVIEK